MPGAPRQNLAAQKPQTGAAREGAAAWYLVQLKPGGFDRARRNLLRLGYDVFMPLREVTRPRRGRFVVDAAPLFPGYIFVRIGEDAPGWRVIQSTYGVLRLVCFEPGRPTPVPPALMESLHRACDANGYLRPPEDLRPGQPVQVISGPFAGALTHIVEAPQTDRIYVLLDIMGRGVRAALSRSEVHVVDGRGDL